MGTLWDSFGLVVSPGHGESEGMCGLQRLVEHVFNRDVSYCTKAQSQSFSEVCSQVGCTFVQRLQLSPLPKRALRLDCYF